MSSTINVIIENDGLARLHMNDQEGRNVFSEHFIRSLIEGLDELEKKHKPKVVILHGLPDVFCGGADKDSLIDLAEGRVHMQDLEVSERFIKAPFPMIAAMEGHAMGGGLLLGLSCDMVIAARESRYGAVFMNMGFTPGMGCTTLLREAMGPFLAQEMMYTGKRFRGSELASRGTLLNGIVGKSEVMPLARDMALRICEKTQKSLYLLKGALSARKKKLLIEARLQEDLMHNITFTDPDTREMINELYANPKTGG